MTAKRGGHGVSYGVMRTEMGLLVGLGIFVLAAIGIWRRLCRLLTHLWAQLCWPSFAAQFRLLVALACVQLSACRGLFGVLLEDRSLPSQCPVVARLAHSLEGAGVAGRLVITFAVMLIALARLVGHLPGDCHESASFRGEGHRLSYIFRLRQMSCYRTSIPATSSPQLRCSSQ